MRRLQAPAGHEPGIDQHQDRAFCPAIRETSTYAQMCAAAQPLCGRVETVWVQPQSFDDGRQPESRSSQLTGGPQSIDWGNRVVNIYLRFADSTAVPGSLGLCSRQPRSMTRSTHHRMQEWGTACMVGVAAPPTGRGHRARAAGCAQRTPCGQRDHFDLQRCCCCCLVVFRCAVRGSTCRRRHLRPHLRRCG